MTDKHIHVREIETSKIIHSVQAEYYNFDDVRDGMSINLNSEVYYLDDSDFDEEPDND